MADTHGHGEHGHDDHGKNIFQIYMIVAVVLLICTAASFVVNQFVQAKVTAFLLILAVACIKAALVGVYFMHLKWDWKLLYFLIVPAFILGAMMMVVLLPDTFFGMLHDARDQMEISRRVTAELTK